jgi:hypothetical protein
LQQSVKFVRFYGLGKKIIEAAGKKLFFHPGNNVGCKGRDRQFRKTPAKGADGASRLHAVHFRHHVIHEHKVKRMRLKPCSTFYAGRSG